MDGPVPYDLIARSIEQHKTKTGIGAHSIFLGQIRGDILGDKKVTAIEYSSYQEMALQKMQEIREDVFSRYPLSCIHVYHSLGTVKKGEICFFVFTSSSHRKEAIAACEELVDRVKKELPIWGREIMEGENYQWKKNN